MCRMKTNLKLCYDLTWYSCVNRFLFVLVWWCCHNPLHAILSIFFHMTLLHTYNLSTSSDLTESSTWCSKELLKPRASNLEAIFHLHHLQILTTTSRDKMMQEIVLVILHGQKIQNCFSKRSYKNLLFLLTVQPPRSGFILHSDSWSFFHPAVWCCLLKVST
jgi:hypothetical protein